MDFTATEKVEVTGEGVRVQVDRDLGAVRRGRAPDAQRIAIVTNREVLFGLGRMYQLLHGEDDFEVDLFESLASGEAWLLAPEQTEPSSYSEI